MPSTYAEDVFGDGNGDVGVVQDSAMVRIARQVRVEEHLTAHTTRGKIRHRYDRYHDQRHKVPIAQQITTQHTVDEY